MLLNLLGAAYRKCCSDCSTSAERGVSCGHGATIQWYHECFEHKAQRMALLVSRLLLVATSSASKTYSSLDYRNIASRVPML